MALPFLERSGDNKASATTEDVQLFASNYLPVDQNLVWVGAVRECCQSGKCMCSFAPSLSRLAIAMFA